MLAGVQNSALLSAVGANGGNGPQAIPVMLVKPKALALAAISFNSEKVSTGITRWPVAASALNRVMLKPAEAAVNCATAAAPPACALGVRPTLGKLNTMMWRAPAARSRADCAATSLAEATPAAPACSKSLAPAQMAYKPFGLAAPLLAARNSVIWTVTGRCLAPGRMELESTATRAPPCAKMPPPATLDGLRLPP